MISAKSNRFEYVDRGFKDSIVLIPGWAADYRVFSDLNLSFNYIIPVSFSPWGFTDDLAEFLMKRNISKISLLGYSLGGFVASEFTYQYPSLVDELILVSIRRRYKAEELKEVRKNLKKNKSAYLYKVYSQGFYEKEELSRFKDMLLKTYLNQMDLDYLLSTLDYFVGSEIKPESLKGIKKIKIIHGEEDSIAPIREAIEIKNNLDNAQLIVLKKTGHNPFFRKDFSKKING